MSVQPDKPRPIRTLEFWLENLIFPVFTAVAVGLILKWAAVGVADKSADKNAEGRLKQQVVDGVAAGQADCRILMNPVSFDQHSQQELVDVRESSFRNINSAAIAAETLAGKEVAAGFRKEIVSSFVDCSNLALGAKSDPDTAEQYRAKRILTWKAILEGANWWSAWLGDPVHAARPAPELTQRGYSPEAVSWWQSYLSWKEAHPAAPDWTSFPGAQ